MVTCKSPFIKCNLAPALKFHNRAFGWEGELINPFCVLFEKGPNLRLHESTFGSFYKIPVKRVFNIDLFILSNLVNVIFFSVCEDSGIAKYNSWLINFALVWTDVWSLIMIKCSLYGDLTPQLFLHPYIGLACLVFLKIPQILALSMWVYS